ncbi:MAG: cytochrome P450 family protein, partial [Mycobacterium sp.]
FGPVWLVTRYDDVVSVLGDDRFVKDRAGSMPAGQRGAVRNLPRLLAPLERGLLSLDGAEHDRLRALVHQAFTPRRIELMRDQVQQRVDELLDAAIRRGEMDVRADLALPLAIVLIARILGVPEQDTPKFARWSAALIHAPQRRYPATAVPSIVRFLRYLRRLIDQRAADPHDDLISAMLAAQEGDDRLSTDEILAMAVLLLTAGHETTVNLITSGIWALLGHRDQLTRWRSEPALGGTGTEELLRYVVPAETATQRWASSDVEIAGVTIARGSLVLAALASANRDPNHFTDPENLDIARHPNRHLSFGRGTHYCLGAPLARMEARIAITEILTRCPNITLAVDPAQLRWRGGLVLRGLRALPVRLT